MSNLDYLASGNENNFVDWQHCPLYVRSFWGSEDWKSKIIEQCTTG